jgi:Flp pilus assembly protein TadG
MASNIASFSASKKQRGAAGIEFAILFTIFFGVFYAVLSYAFVNLLYQGLIQAAAEGARSAVQLNPTVFASQPAYDAAVTAVAKNAANQALSWMPKTVQDAINKDATGITAAVLNGSVTVITASGNQAIATRSITVTVTYANYKANPILPLIDLPFLGTIPSVPANLAGSSSLRVTPVIGPP